MAMNKQDSLTHVVFAAFAIAVGAPIVWTHGVNEHAVIFAWGAFGYLILGLFGLAISRFPGEARARP
jgi:hypothetical protein